jgi:hypothetical protein
MSHVFCKTQYSKVPTMLKVKCCSCASAPHHENVWGMEVRLHAFLTSVHKRMDEIQSQSGCGGKR